MGGGKKTSGKVRFDGVDVAAMVSHLQRTLLGRRIINIYDSVSGGADGYLFKLDGNDKPILFVESGIRFHTTTHQASLQQEGMPSPFCTKLRKHLRGLRLERAVQFGLDRVVELTFGTGASRHSLILELYARGNILLTNKEYKILSLLRSHEYAEKDVQVRVGHVYPVTYATSLRQEGVLQEEKSNEDSNSVSRQQSNGILGLSGSDAQQWALSQLAPKEDETNETSAGNQASGKGGRKGKDVIPLKALLLKPTSGVYHYGPSLIEHCILSASLDPNLKISTKTLKDALPVSAWESLVLALREEGTQVLERLASSKVGGYILYRTRESSKDADQQPDDALQHADKILEEFQPHLLKQHEGRLVVRYDTFAEAVDDFFFHIGGQKRALRAEAAEAAAREKLSKVRKDQERRVESLTQDQEKLEKNAHLVKYHAEDVDKALGVINSALDTGMDWEALEQLVEVEQKNENPIALLIKRLDLEKDSMVLSLPDMLSDNGEGKSVDVSVSLKESAYGNVRNMFDACRAAKEKSGKTLEASTKALKAAEATAQRQLAEAQKKAKSAVTMAPKRKSHWFEKFHWFITSDNYLVLGGRDAQQNEMLVKRYLRPGDAYLHADVHGAASCVLRAKRRRTVAGGKTPVLPLSEQALREAGNFTICLSSAWASRMVTSAWWVEPSQVSKTAPTGEYLTVGSFMVRGKKNFLPPSQLEMGLAVLFRLGDDDSIARHKNERRDFALLDNDMGDLEEDFPNVSLKEESTTAEKVMDSKRDKVAPLVQEETEAVAPLSEEVIDSADTNEGQTAETESEPANDMPAHTTDVLMGDSQEDSSTIPVAEPVVDRSKVSEADGQSKRNKKGLSVRDRKLIKRYGSLEAAEKAVAESNQNKNNNMEAEKPKKNESEGVAENQPKRGKKSKMKRAAKKYDHQDDDDRELAMLALHGGEKKLTKKKNGKRGEMTVSQQKASVEAAALLVKDSSKVVDGLPDNVQNVLASCVSVKSPDSEDVVIRWDKFDADVLELLVALDSEEEQLAAANRLLYLKQSTRVDNFSASLAGIVRTIGRYGHKNLETSIEVDGTDGARRKTKAEKAKEKETWREALAEEGIAEENPGDGEETVDDTAEISKLTGKPHPDDTLLYAIPVCAPYQTISQYRYKVKLTPGAQKRGKAAKQCLELFLKGGNDTSSGIDRDRELIKREGDNNWVQTLCSNVKISAPGTAKKQKGGGRKGGKKK